MIPETSFRLDRAAPGTLQQKIQAMIATGILSGRFRAGERLPSSRTLAAHLGVARITVTLAYTELVADDYLTARGRSGYYISATAPRPVTLPPQAPRLSTVDWAARLADQPGLGLTKPANWRAYRYNFIYGQPDAALFDSANWRLCALQALGRRDFGAMADDLYDQDDPMLVDYLCRQTLPRRGIEAAPDEVLLTLGAQNALWLTAHLLLGPGRRAVIEDPGYPALRAIVAQTGAQALPVSVDAEGLVPDLPPASVAFVTPGHQCPTGATLSPPRRRTLLDWAEAQDALVVEDDYDFELTHSGSPAPALRALDGGGRVIHVGSFSKSIFPGLRLGYLVGPAPFIRAARALRATVLRHPPGLIQRTAAHFLTLGHHDAQVRRMARAFADRKSEMLRALSAQGLTPPGPIGATSLWLRLPGVDTFALSERVRADSVLIEPGGAFFAGHGGREWVRLAWSSVGSSILASGLLQIFGARGQSGI